MCVCVCVCVYCVPLVYMSSVKTRPLTQLPDRKESTRNGSATDVDVELFVAWWHCRTPQFHLPIMSHRHRLYIRSNVLTVRIWDLRYSEHKDRGWEVITKNWHRLTRVRKAGGGLLLRHLHVALVLRSSYILMVKVIYFDMGMYTVCYDIMHYVAGVTRSATKSSTEHVDFIRT